MRTTVLSSSVILAQALSFAITSSLFSVHCHHLDLHSFPTRRSSDLDAALFRAHQSGDGVPARRHVGRRHGRSRARRDCGRADRKSTRLNSSHLGISYAVFCLKKKTKLRAVPPPEPYKGTGVRYVNAR